MATYTAIKEKWVTALDIAGDPLLPQCDGIKLSKADCQEIVKLLKRAGGTKKATKTGNFLSVGDVVKVIKDTSSHFMQLGDLGVIRSIDENSIPPHYTIEGISIGRYLGRNRMVYINDVEEYLGNGN